MPNRLSAHRYAATVQQSFRCYYCQAPVWEQDESAFVAKYGVSRRQAALLRCTAEHLHARSEGGRDTRYNIVAACLHCNTTRHKAREPLQPDAYRARVLRRVAQGCWLTCFVLDARRQQRGRRPSSTPR